MIGSGEVHVSHFSAIISEKQASIVAKALVRPEADAPFREAILDTDGRARTLLGASLDATHSIDEVQIVANLKTLPAIVHGAEEQLLNLDYLKALTIPSLWHGQITPDAGHAPHWENSPNDSTSYWVNLWWTSGQRHYV